MYSMGEGVTQDHYEAVKWFLRAANQGNEVAQHSLGIAYRDGRGVPQDYVLAYMWLNLAVLHPLPPADAIGGLMRSVATNLRNDNIRARDELAAKMTPSQIAEGQKRTREWKAKLER
jgi:uncharacterized protein